MKVGDLVLDETIDQMGIVVEVDYEYGESNDYIVVQLCDGSEVLASEDDLKLIVSGRII